MGALNVVTLMGRLSCVCGDRGTSSDHVSVGAERLTNRRSPSATRLQERRVETTSTTTACVAQVRLTTVTLFVLLPPTVPTRTPTNTCCSVTLVKWFLVLHSMLVFGKIRRIRFQASQGDETCFFMAALYNRGAIIFLPCSFFPSSFYLFFLA